MSKKDKTTPVVLGQAYRDTISGFEGVAIAKTDWLHGCVRVSLEGPMVDGKEQAFTFDEQRLVDVATSEPPLATARAGGNRENIGRATDPSR